METIQTLSDIDTTTKEGKYFLAALGMLTCQKRLKLSGKYTRGSAMTPDEMIAEVDKVKKVIYFFNH